MAGDTDLENDERRSTGTSTAALMIKRPSRLAVQAGATYRIGQKRVQMHADALSLREGVGNAALHTGPLRPLSPIEADAIAVLAPALP